MNYYDELSGAGSPHAANALLFAWLGDDDHRPALYRELRTRQPVLTVRAAVAQAEDQAPAGDAAQPKDEKPAEPPPVYLLTRKEDIDLALRTFSNSPYASVGGGTFVLALDNGKGHEGKRNFLMSALRASGAGSAEFASEIEQLAAVSCFHAMVGPCKRNELDLVTDIAEQAALRFVAALFGIPDKDHVLLQETMRRIYDAMIMQMFARHFVTEPLLIDIGKAAMGKLAQRIGELIADASPAQQTARVSAVLRLDEAQAPALLKVLAKEVAKLAPALAQPAAEFGDQIAQPGLARRTADFLDKALNYAAVRAALEAFVARHQGTPEALRQGFGELIQEIIRKKVEPEDRLAPRRFMLKDGKPQASGIEDTPGDLIFRETLIERMARSPGQDNNFNDLAVAVVGTIAGLMTNVTAGACIAINEYFKLPADVCEEIVKRAGPMTALTAAGIAASIGSAQTLSPFVREALRLHPTAAFIPRRTLSEISLQNGKDTIRIPAGAEVLIPLGAATRDLDETHQPDTFRENRQPPEPDMFKYVFGHPANDEKSHRCVGEHIALPLIAHIVRSVLSLKGLARQVVDGKPATLRKKWGYICESFPLQHDRARSLRQSPLNVVMKIKSPTAVHAEALKLVIRYGAPSIEQLLARSRMVHFARFVFLNNDTELGLFTVYDGPFDDYIDHFARVAGRLFDRIFEHIEEQPPTPVRSHPREFVEHIRRYDLDAAQGYFFSAYPAKEVKDI